MRLLPISSPPLARDCVTQRTNPDPYLLDARSLHGADQRSCYKIAHFDQGHRVCNADHGPEQVRPEWLIRKSQRRMPRSGKHTDQTEKTDLVTCWTAMNKGRLSACEAASSRRLWQEKVRRHSTYCGTWDGPDSREYKAVIAALYPTSKKK